MKIQRVNYFANAFRASLTASKATIIKEEARRKKSQAIKQVHQGFEDPPQPGVGSEEERLTVFRRVRDELRVYLAEFAKF